MSDQSAQEPTMEEILASIRRIISEDETPAQPQAEEEAHAGPVGAPEVSALTEDEPADDDVLELTEPEPEPEPEPVFAAPEPPPTPARNETAPTSAPPQPVGRSGDLDIFDGDPVAPTRQPPPRSQAPEPGDDGLLSASTAATAASAFGALSQRVAMPSDGQTLDDVVRELLKPLLRDWLDRNLPGIVEAKVQAEVERISRLNVR